MSNNHSLLENCSLPFTLRVLLLLLATKEMEKAKQLTLKQRKAKSTLLSSMGKEVGIAILRLQVKNSI